MVVTVWFIADKTGSLHASENQRQEKQDKKLATDNLLYIDDVPLPCALIRNGIVFKNSLFDSFPNEAQNYFEKMASNFLKNSKTLNKTIDFNKHNLQGKVYINQPKDSDKRDTAVFCVHLFDTLQDTPIDNIVFDHSGEAMVLTDKDDDIVKVNEAFKTVFGYDEPDILMKNPSFLRDGLNQVALIKKAFSEIEKSGHWSGEIAVRKASGEIIHTWQSTSSIVRNGKTQGYITIFSDITTHVNEIEKVRFLAYHDYLTALPNRMLLEDRFEQLKRHLNRNKSNQESTFTIVFIDLNNFKIVNDTHGHAFGDNSLISFAKALSESIREEDTASRISGDEFVLLLEQQDKPLDVGLFFKRLDKNVARQLKENNCPIKLEYSYGLATYPNDGESLKSLLHVADNRMYEMKKQPKQ
ncbi:diguanylate cyclase [Vibrio cholerae]|nr:diguanylate cyclase [Vibrio cholerae]